MTLDGDKIVSSQPLRTHPPRPSIHRLLSTQEAAQSNDNPGYDPPPYEEIDHLTQGRAQLNVAPSNEPEPHVAAPASTEAATRGSEPRILVQVNIVTSGTVDNASARVVQRSRSKSRSPSTPHGVEASVQPQAPTQQREASQAASATAVDYDPPSYYDPADTPPPTYESLDIFPTTPPTAEQLAHAERLARSVIYATRVELNAEREEQLRREYMERQEREERRADNCLNNFCDSIYEKPAWMRFIIFSMSLLPMFLLWLILSYTTSPATPAANNDTIHFTTEKPGRKWWPNE